MVERKPWNIDKYAFRHDYSNDAKFVASRLDHLELPTFSSFTENHLFLPREHAGAFAERSNPAQKRVQQQDPSAPGEKQTPEPRRDSLYEMCQHAAVGQVRFVPVTDTASNPVVPVMDRRQLDDPVEKLFTRSRGRSFQKSRDGSFSRPSMEPLPPVSPDAASPSRLQLLSRNSIGSLTELPMLRRLESATKLSPIDRRPSSRIGSFIAELQRCNESFSLHEDTTPHLAMLASTSFRVLDSRPTSRIGHLSPHLSTS